MTQTIARERNLSAKSRVLHSRIVSLKYAPSFYEDYLAIQKLLVAQPSTRPSTYPAARPLALKYKQGPPHRKLLEDTRRYTAGERKIKLSRRARQRLRGLMHRIGLTNCECILPKIRQIDLGYNVKKTKIPIFELHCPRVRGSTATYLESETSSAADFKIELSFLGTGTNFGTTFEEKTSDEITVRGTCCEIVREARIVIRKVSYVCEKCKTRTPTKFVFGLAPGGEELIPLTIKRNKDGCDVPIDELKPEDYSEIPIPKKVEKRRSITIADGTRTQSSLGLSIPGMELRGTVAVETLRDVQHEYTLQGPRTYYCYPVTGLNKFWSTSRYNHESTKNGAGRRLET